VAPATQLGMNKSTDESTQYGSVLGREEEKSRKS